MLAVPVSAKTAAVAPAAVVSEPPLASKAPERLVRLTTLPAAVGVGRVEGGERVEGAGQAAVAVDGGGAVDEPEHAGDVEGQGGDERALHRHTVVADLVLDRVRALPARLRVIDVAAVGVDRHV